MIGFENIYIFYTFGVSSNFSRAFTIAGTLELHSGCASCYQYHVKLDQVSPLHIFYTKQKHQVN